MPNWCNNNVTISHPDSQKMAALAEAIREGNFCKHVIPTPKDLIDTVAGFPGEDKREAHEAQMKRNLELYGAKDWYDFQTSRWGTKWDVEPYDPSDVKVENNTIQFGFDSAWSPPIGVYEALVEDGFTVSAQYYEPGMAFVGDWTDGCDDFYDISGMKSHEVRDVIGEFLDDNFGISESMAEYEAEEDDELTEWYEDGVESKGLEPHK
jgi:hypothetical protein